MWRTWLFEFTDENSNMCGEQFCVELKDATKKEARAYAKEQFPHERIKCLGEISEDEAEWLGLDTY